MRDTLDDLYFARRYSTHDMTAHMDRLQRLANECEHITEFGVRDGNSTIAFLQGVVRSPDGNGVVVSYDIEPPRTTDIARVVSETNRAISWVFKQQDTMLISDIEETDMLLFDTLHTKKQLMHELVHASRVRRYLVFHDVRLFGLKGERGDDSGILPAIWHFMCDSREGRHWYPDQYYDDCCGLLVLHRY